MRIFVNCLHLTLVHTAQTTDTSRNNVHYLWGMPSRRDGAPRGRCARPPCLGHLYTRPWCHSSAPAFGHSAAPRQPSSARPLPYRVSFREETPRPKKVSQLIINEIWRYCSDDDMNELHRGIYRLTIIEDGTDKATQGSLAIFTNSGPWKFCHQGKDRNVTGLFSGPSPPPPIDAFANLWCENLRY